MKKSLFIPLLLVILSASAQTKILAVNPNCNLTVKSTDTAWVQALVTSSDGYGSVGISFATGPSTPVIGNMITDWTTGLQAKVRIPVTKLSVGMYTFAGIAKTLTGSTMPFADTVYVVAPPPPPVPRTVVSVTFSLVNGVWLPKYTYDDGSTQ